MNTQDIYDRIQEKYLTEGLWGETDYVNLLPEGLERGSDPHLAFLTLVITISGGRQPQPLWQAARQTYQDDPEVFNPKFLAYTKPGEIQFRLQTHKLIKRVKTESTTWQRIGQALVMRANGSVQKLLKDHHQDAVQLLHMLQKSKTTFPLLSGPQTAPRWLHGLATAGGQTIANIERLSLPASPAGERALESLNIPPDHIPVQAFASLDTLGRLGCEQRKQKQTCPVAPACPVAKQCKYSE